MPFIDPVPPSVLRETFVIEVNAKTNSIPMDNTLKPFNTTVSEDLAKSPNLLTKLAQAQVTGSNALRGAIGSTLGMFEAGNKNIANALGVVLRDVFGNTQNSNATTTTTTVSDPIKTNLLTKTLPKSSGFKIGGLEAGSTGITFPGSTSNVGTNAEQMSGVSPVTLLRRFRQDVALISSIPTLVRNQLSQEGLVRLLGSTTIVEGTDKNAGIKITGGQVYSALNTAFGGTKTKSINVSDFTNYTSRVSGLSSSLGGLNLNPYYVENGNATLLSESGAIINTHKSGIDATSANGLLQLLATGGCSVSIQNVRSANEQSSLFSLGMSLAALLGFDDLVNELLQCNQASTVVGQQSIINAFTGSLSTQLDTAALMTDHITFSSDLDPQTISEQILSNPNLTDKDFLTTEKIFSKMNRSTQEMLMLPGTAQDAYPLYDFATVQTTSDSFIDRVFEDRNFSDLQNAVYMQTSKEGLFVPTVFA